MGILILIPARGGSKGIPGKNIKLLAGRPLIHYSIEVARSVVPDQHICLSSDDDAIIACARDTGLSIPFKRPDELSTDQAGTYEVILHALDHYKSRGIHYDAVLLLQPTSPLRRSLHLKEALKLYSDDLDMVVSVMEAKSNPYANLLEEKQDGFLHRLSGKVLSRRQEAPRLWQLNGSIYIINSLSLRKHTSLWDFPRIRKYEMPEEYSVDIDTPFDWKLAEWLVSRQDLSLDFF
jgi:N-acylneuraminate cytidylyltransferase